VYFWQGRDSSINERGASALLTIDVSKEAGGDALQIRVLQQKESRHFLAMFPQGMIIHKGKLVERTAAVKKQCLYDIRLLNDDNAYPRLRAVECGDQSPNNLNSNHCFISFTAPSKIIIWNGKHSTSEERNFAKNVANRLVTFNSKPSMDITTVDDGQETDEFFKTFNLTGVTQQQWKKHMQSVIGNPRPASNIRLFLFSNATGFVNVERLYNWCQDDLENASVMLLDAKDYMYLWLGIQSNYNEHKVSIETALEYVKKDSQGRSEKAEYAVFIINPLEEPTKFTACFQAWGEYRNRTLQELAKTKKEKTPSLVMAIEKLKDFQRQTYSYQDLLSENYGASVDRTKLEIYLADDEFEQVFKMNREDFSKLPDWKQQKLKQEVYLF
jgi:villin 1/advillin